MIAKCWLLGTVLLLSTATTSWAQSQTGGSFGTLPSGSAASRSNGGSSSSHGHHRDSGDDEQSARNSGGSGSNGGGREIDARDVERTSPVARQASTPQH
jgi:hypothetical protein